MKNNKLSKFFALLITVSFVFSSFTTAFAVESTEETSSVETTATEETATTSEPTTEPVTEPSTDPTNSTEPTEPVVEYNGVAGKNLNYSFDKNTGVLTISGNGTATNDYTLDSPAPWSYFAKEITSVNLTEAEKLSDIGDYAFANLNKMKSITLPEKIKNIGEGAFLNTSVLSSLKLDTTVKSIGVDSFKNSGVKTLKFMNPSTVIYGKESTIPPTTTVKGFSGSTAYKYAKKYLRTFYMMISDISFTETHDVITKGDSYTVEYKINPTKPTKSTLKWYTTDKKIATVNSKGVVKTKKVGTCYVYAKATDGSGVQSANFKIIVTSFRLNKYIFTNNNCYKESSAIDPKGIIVHSTGANTPYLRSYIPNWNVSKPGGREVCVHGFVGINNSGGISTYQTLPFEMAAWGCGGGTKGSYNYNPGYIQFECCEDNLTSKTHFKKIYNEATDFCAYLCLKYSLSYKKVVSHAGANAQGYASAHGDIDHWLKRYGLTMNDFRNTVKKKIYAIDSNPDLTSGSKHKKVTVKRETTLWSKDFADEYGTGSKAKLTLEKGSTVSFYNDDFGGWSKVKAQGKTGYVRNKDIDLAYASKYDTITLSKGTKVYAKPSKSAKNLKTTLKSNTKVKQVCKITSGTKKNWRLIIYKNKEYYVYKK